jgi:hypothetical protein
MRSGIVGTAVDQDDVAARDAACGIPAFGACGARRSGCGLLDRAGDGRDGRGLALGRRRLADALGHLPGQVLLPKQVVLLSVGSGIGSQ